MKRYLIIAALLALGACSTFQSATVSTVKAQQAVDLAVAAYKVDLDAENIYLAQAPCGLKNSPAPPLCASYAVGVLWKSADQKVRAAITDTQVKIDALGTDPKIIDAAIAAMQLALAQLNTFTATYKVSK